MPFGRERRKQGFSRRKAHPLNNTDAECTREVLRGSQCTKLLLIHRIYLDDGLDYVLPGRTATGGYLQRKLWHTGEYHS